MATPIERRTIKVSVSTSSSTFEADITAGIDAQAPEADGWVIADRIDNEYGGRDKLVLIYVMERTP